MRFVAGVAGIGTEHCEVADAHKMGGVGAELVRREIEAADGARAKLQTRFCGTQINLNAEPVSAPWFVDLRIERSSNLTPPHRNPSERPRCTES